MCRKGLPAVQNWEKVVVLQGSDGVNDQCWLMMGSTKTLVLSCSLGPFEYLPPELLETILGTLDVRTLCTARLVCTRFSVAASRFICSITLSAKDLRSRPNTNLDSFPKLSQVTDVAERDYGVVAHPLVRDAATEVLLLLQPAKCWSPLPRLPPLPNLVSVTVPKYSRLQGLFFPQTLQELNLGPPVLCSDAHPLTRLTRLTGLTTVLRDVGLPHGGILQGSVSGLRTSSS
jgi:hypothetical protein